jgi:hypothetical protein
VEADTRPEFGDLGLYPGIPHYEAWRRLSLASLGRLIDRRLEYTLLEGEGDRRCPFYINYGFVAGPPILLQKLYGVLGDLQPGLSLQLRNDFYGQVAIALAVEHAHLPWRALPMRFNFPNDRAADLRYPQELDQVVLIHYLRNSQFDRHRIFAERNAFDAFLAMPTIGSDRVLQDHVCRITGGVFPFAQPR